MSAGFNCELHIYIRKRGNEEKRDDRGMKKWKRKDVFTALFALYIVVFVAIGFGVYVYPIVKFLWVFVTGLAR